MEHYTRNTETVTAYCLKCRAFTEHRVDQGRKGPCLDPAHPVHGERSGRAAAKAKEPKPEKEKTGDLFE